MKESVKNIMRRLGVFVLTICMITSLFSPLTKVEAGDEATVVSADDKVAYMIDFSTISQYSAYCLSDLKYLATDVKVSFNYYLTEADSNTLRVKNYTGSVLKDQTKDSEYLQSNKVETFTYTGTSDSSQGFMVAIDNVKTTTSAKLYIWDVVITLGDVSYFNTAAKQYSSGVDGTEFTIMKYNQIPFPAYVIDFTSITAGNFWCLSKFKTPNSTKVLKISFDYYLSGTNSSSLDIKNYSRSQIYEDVNAKTHFLKAGVKSTFSFEGTCTDDHLGIAVHVAQNTTQKLYIWNINITYDGENITEPNRTQPQTAVQNARDRILTDTTYPLLPFPAYRIDFAGLKQFNMWCLTSAKGTPDQSKELVISFKYYLTGTSSNTLSVKNNSRSQIYPDATTGSNLLVAGEERTFYWKGTCPNDHLQVGVQVDYVTTQQLYIWDVEITFDGATFFNPGMTQPHGDVKPLSTSNFRELTVQELPIPSGPRSTFNENNIIARFGVVSDTHLSGSWNQARSRAKFAHMIDVLQKVAEEDGEQLDALLINGDLVDAVGNGDNVSNKTEEGKKQENFYEANLFAQGLWGGTNGDSSYNDVKNNTTTGYGKGLAANVKLLYALGNHDEQGEGKATFNQYETMYSGYYFAAVICGWQNKGEYKQYITDVVNYYNENKGTIVVEDTVNKEAVTDTDGTFETAYGVSLASAVDKFHKYYGHDLEAFNDTEGLFYGNRHMKIGDMDVVAIELSTSETSVAFLEEICKTSVADNPNRPIFVMTHYKTDANVPGEDQSPNTDNIAAFEQLLKKYPQIIVWGGHSHSYLHSDAAIDTTNGYVAVDTGVVAYSSQSYLTMRAGAGNSTVTSNVMLAVNAASNENHAQSTGCYVEVDANYNVRIKRIDLYRSYSNAYAENNTLYSSTEFRIYNRAASCTPVDEAVFIREPWDITDINAFGKHLLDYTSDRASNAATPEWTEDAEISLTSINGQIKAEFVMDATVDNHDGDTDTADGLVYMYVVELYDASDQLVDRMYYTNKFYDYSNTTDIPALSAYYIFDELEGDAGYKVKMYPVSEYGVVGEAITKEATTRSKSTANFTDAYVINFTTTDTGFYTLTSVPSVNDKEVKISFDYYLDGGAENNINLFDITGSNNTNISNSEQKYLKTGRNTVDFTFTGTSSMCLGLQFTNATDAKLYIWNVNITVAGDPIFSASCQQQSNGQKIPTLTAITYDDIAVMDNDITGDFATDVCDLIRMKKYDADEEKETFYMHKGNLAVEDSEDMRDYLVQ